MAEQSTVHPDGWIGDPAELQRARRYRAALRWGTGPFYLLLIASVVVAVSGGADVLWTLMVIATFAWVLLTWYMHRQINQIIGRKWSSSLELKERRRQDEPWPSSGFSLNPKPRISETTTRAPSPIRSTTPCQSQDEPG